MDIDPRELLCQAETARNEREARSASLNAAVAATIALLATFMGICRVKDDNIVQAMQQAQADNLNYRDDQFDLSNAPIAIAVSLLAVTALTRLWLLYWVSLLPTATGLLMDMAGLTAWDFHPTALVELLC